MARRSCLAAFLVIACVPLQALFPLPAWADTGGPDAIRSAMGTLSWGMRVEDLLATLGQRIKSRYETAIHNAEDLDEEAILRGQQRRELAALRQSLVRFDGEETPWDESFLRGEFTHGHAEAMLSARDANSHNYYFFIQDRLWKWYKVFDREAFAGKNFRAFVGVAEDTFGEGRRVRTDRGPRRGEYRSIEWQGPDTRLRALDATDRRSYALLFEHKATLAKLDTLRADPEPGPALAGETRRAQRAAKAAETKREREAAATRRAADRARRRAEAKLRAERARAEQREARRAEALEPVEELQGDDPLGGLESTP